MVNSYRNQTAAVTVGQNDQSLCRICRKLNLQELSPLDISIAGRPCLEFHSPESPTSTGSCVLCSLFSAMRVPSSRMPQDGTIDYDVIAYSAFSCCDYVATSWIPMTSPAKHTCDSVFLAVVPVDPDSREPLVQLNEIQEHCWRNGFISQATTSSIPQECLQARIMSSSIDYEYFRSLIRHCEENHWGECRESKLRQLPQLKLIDCETLCIVTTSTNCAYLALSYVWGHPKVPQAERNPQNVAIPATEVEKKLLTFPVVIKDAITVTKGLGYRFLWVDRCSPPLLYCHNYVK
jgi:hypothetical protein